MKTQIQPDPSIFLIFGAGGDLASRKLVPALYNLFLDEWMPKEFEVIGLGHGKMSDGSFRQNMRKAIGEFSRRGKAEDEPWKAFSPRLSFLEADLEDSGVFTKLEKRLSDRDKKWNTKANRIFYLALPPRMIQPVTRELAKAHLNSDRERARIVVEKPFGRDRASARELNLSLTERFDESQIYRIDHYLGKETLQNLMAFRFANTLFEPIWNRHYIDHVQITVAEQDGVGHRGHYYDQSGALRDMIQNHLIQILCLIAMEAPNSFSANEVRNKKVDVLNALRAIPAEQVHQFAVRGQYGGGRIGGKAVPAYRNEPRVAPHSSTETYAAVRLFVDNWRWQDVPFYLRTGKRLPAKISEVCIQFRPVPHQMFAPGTLLDWRSNRLIISIQPQEGILLRFEAKYPGPTMHLSPVLMQFYYKDTFKVAPPEAYETLLLDVMRNDATLFMRADQEEAAWSAISPVLESWDSTRPTDFPNYGAGTWGPEEAQILIAQGGHSWVEPTFLKCQQDIAVCKVNLAPE